MKALICVAECGPGIISLAAAESKTITSPNFDKGGPYPTGKKCVWLVKVSGEDPQSNLTS
jgi:hypothetical protein